jgi:azurin
MNNSFWKRTAAVALFGAVVAAAGASAAPRVIQIKGGDDMKYSVKTINATAGEELTIVLSVKSAMAKDAMAHNFVLIDPSTDVNTFVTKAAVARKTEFIPAALADKILAHSPLAGDGETVEVTFKAPAKPGTYPYLCTFPGHYAGGMQGQLIVK